jgi:phthiocerol/phenolphthiocerol synthesis type-I polyketide synthase C
MPLWLVTSGAQQGGGGEAICGAALWAFGRVLRNETPGLVLRMVDLPPGMLAPDRARRLAAELTAGSPESEIVWTPSGRHVPRVRRGLPPVWAQPDDAIAAAIAPPGQLDRFEWAPAPRCALRPGEIAIDVHAAGLNFRDVMAASGMLPEDVLLDGFAGTSLGLECAGVVSAVGAGVETLAIGDRVVGFAPAALTSRAVTRADAVTAMPPHMIFAAAATLPVAFVTARYALLILARLQPGETVLIHAASGGVGLAAIQTATVCGATVIATAGSATKRAFLRAVGADHVCDSRELRFVSAVRQATGGAGVDVVLNSLSGAAMEASLELLKPFGRFVELGKRDFAENRTFRSRLLRQNIAYFAVDVDQLPARRPALAKVLLDEVAAALAAGEIRPLAHRCLTFAETGDAFRLMQAAQHIGKLVLLPDRHAGIAISCPPDFVLRRDAAYVVTGGLGGFGFAAARWLAERGAGHLALVGRRGADTPGAAARIAELEASGAVVSIHAADVAHSDMLADALDALRRQGLPIRGVVHAAAEIVDGTAATLSPHEIATALCAKAAGALNLDRLTRNDPLDLFWLFSSATSFIGAPGQGAYVAANAMLEALARRRHAEGLPALAIAWGPITDIGVLAERPADRDALSRRLGARPMRSAQALAALPAMAAGGLPVVAFADFAGHGAALPIFADPLFDELRAATADVAADEALPDRLAGLDAEGKRDLLALVIANEAAHILRYREGGIDLHRPLAELGMDSLMALELRLALEARLRIDIPLMSLAEGASVAALAARLSDTISQPGQRAAVIDLAARHETVLDRFDLADLGADE